MTSETTGVNVHSFTNIDGAVDISPYVATLEIFDAIPQLQELKEIARQGLQLGDHVLDVGCGYGIESFKLAERVAPGGKVTGVDQSAAFIAKARSRVAEEGETIDFEVGDAQALPFQDATFNAARVERVLVYLSDPQKAVQEMGRVTKPGGTISMIEPDFGTNVINVPDRGLARRIRDYECDINVPQGLLMRDMPWILKELGFTEIGIDTRLLVFPEDLAIDYFIQMGANAQSAGVITADEQEAWVAAIKTLEANGRLFATIGYYLFTAKV